jgi:hypothetical protein
MKKQLLQSVWAVIADGQLRGQKIGIAGGHFNHLLLTLEDSPTGFGNVESAKSRGKRFCMPGRIADTVAAVKDLQPQIIRRTIKYAVIHAAPPSFPFKKSIFAFTSSIYFTFENWYNFISPFFILAEIIY